MTRHLHVPAAVAFVVIVSIILGVVLAAAAVVIRLNEPPAKHNNKPAAVWVDRFATFTDTCDVGNPPAPCKPYPVPSDVR